MGRVVRSEPSVDEEEWSVAKAWTADELDRELKRFEDELKAAGLRPSSVHTYVDRTERFLRWLRGDYHPRRPV